VAGEAQEHWHERQIDRDAERGGDKVAQSADQLQ